VFEEIETGIAAIKALVGKGRSTDAAKRAPRPRKGFAPHLERIHVVIEPDELPEHAGKLKVLIGEDTSERLDVIPPKFRVIVTHRPKYAFKNEDGGLGPGTHHREWHPDGSAAGLYRCLQVRRWLAALSTGGDLLARQGRGCQMILDDVHVFAIVRPGQRNPVGERFVGLIE
jgi:transposase